MRLRNVLPRKWRDRSIARRVAVDYQRLRVWTVSSLRLTSARIRLRSHGDFNRPVCVQVFPNPLSEREYTGLGDFLEGAAFTLALAPRFGAEGRVTLSGTALEDFLVNTYPLPSPNDAPHFYHKQPIPRLTRRNIWFTNRRTTRPWTPELTQALVAACLTPQDHFADYLRREAESLGLEGHRFISVHLRLNDQLRHPERAMPAPLLDRLRRWLQETHEESDLPLVLFSNRSSLGEELDLPFVRYRRGSGGHIGTDPRDATVVKEALADFFLLGSATKVLTMSSYTWVSGFSLTAARTFGTPIQAYELRPATESDAEPLIVPVLQDGIRGGRQSRRRRTRQSLDV